MAVVFGNFGVDQLLEVGFQPLVRAFFIRAHQARVAHHIGSKDRGKTAGLAHVSGIPALRRPARNVASYRMRIFGTNPK